MRKIFLTTALCVGSAFFMDAAAQTKPGSTTPPPVGTSGKASPASTKPPVAGTNAPPVKKSETPPPTGPMPPVLGDQAPTSQIRAIAEAKAKAEGKPLPPAPPKLAPVPVAGSAPTVKKP